MELQAKTKRGYLFLETHEFEKANSFFESALNDDSEDSSAYIGKLLIDLKLANIEELDKQLKQFDDNRNYELAYRFADDELKAKLDDYRNSVIANIVRKNEQQQDAKYKIAVLHKESAKTKQEYSDAIKDLLRVGLDYKDVKSQVADCREQMTECDYVDGLNLLNEIDILPDDQVKVDGLIKIIDHFNLLEDYKDSKNKATELQNQVEQLKEKIEKERLEKETQKNAEQAAQKLAKKRKNRRNAIIAVTIIIVFIVVSVVVFFIYKSSINKTMNNYISSNQPSEAYDYYRENSDFIEKEAFDEIVKCCVINSDFETLLDIEYSSCDNTDSSNIVDIVKKCISKEQYENYYSSVLKFYDISNSFIFEGGIYKQYHLLYFLPNDYKDVKDIRNIYNVLVDSGANDSSYFSFINSFNDSLPYDKLSDYCDYQPLNNYLVESSTFMSGRWSDDDGNYISFSKDDDGEHCSYNLPTPSNGYHYDYYRIQDGKFNWYVEDNQNDNVDCFKFTIINNNKMKVYDYTDKKTYIMTR